jgi:hypothetical protein
MHVVNLTSFQVNFENLFNGEKELGKLRKLISRDMEDDNI